KIDVSQAPDIKIIQASIASRIQLDLLERDDEETRANFLYRQLEARLLNKKSKILLIFDDICTEEGIDLKRIGIPFSPEGEASCTILLSSRRSDLYKIMDGNCNFPLGCLKLAEAKILFRDRLGNKISLDEGYMSSKYISMEDDLLVKCGGLPRAITTLAEVLKVSWPDWDDVVSQLRNHNLSEVDGVMKTLHQPIKLSYDLLESDEKKNFFLLCCLFQPGTRIPIEDLMRCGIGLNLFGLIRSLEDVTQRANLWVNRLKSLSLFECKDDQGSINVHNIIREFAISIASQGKYLLILDDGAQWEHKENCKNYTILSVNARSIAYNKHLSGKELQHLSSDFEHFDGLPKLKALFLNGKSSSLVSGYFTGMKNHRILGMTKMKLSTIPHSLKLLRNLITLSLEHCDIEDASLISTLVSLKVLSLRGSILKDFPPQIGQIGDLRLLDLTRCCFGTFLDGKISDMSQLEGLYLCGSFVNQDTDEVMKGSLVGWLKSFVRLNVLEIEIPSSHNVGDLLLGCTPMRYKIAIGCKVPSSYMELSVFKKVLLLNRIDARMFKKQGLRDLLKRAECLSLSEIVNLKKLAYDLDEDGLADLICLQISHCNQMDLFESGISWDDFTELVLKIAWTFKDFQIFNLYELGIPPQVITRANLSSMRSLDNTEELWELSPGGSASANEIFSNLHTLILDKMPRLKHVWSKELCEGSLSFGKLKKVNIIECDLLENLCLPTFPAALFKLKSLEIVACGRLKEVIKSEIIADNITEFPSLQRLKLDNLSSLLYFCQGSCIVRFPALKELFLSSLPNMLTFLEPKNSDTLCCSPTKGGDQRAQASSNSLMKHKLFNGEIIFPSLENLELSSMEDIEELVEEEHAANAFPKLKALTINALCKLKSIPETILNKLHQLKVNNCVSLDGLFEFNSKSSILSLRNLELVNVSCLKHIPWTLLPNLHLVVIHNCLLGLKSIVSSGNIAQGSVLPKLEFILNIHLEEIVSKECDSELCLLENGTFMFPRLKHVKLHSLPRFVVFSSGSYEAIFPGLEKVEISGCPKLVSFTLGALVTPKMKYLQVDQATVLEQIDVNYFLGCQKQGEYRQIMPFVTYKNLQLRVGCSEIEEGFEQGKVLLESRAQLRTFKQKRFCNEAKDSHLATNGELIPNNANSNQPNCSISLSHRSSTSLNLGTMTQPLSPKSQAIATSILAATYSSSQSPFDVDRFKPQSKPKDDETNAAIFDAYLSWRKQDRLVLVCLRSTLSNRLLTYVARAQTAYDAWTMIESMFRTQTRAQLMLLKDQLQTLSKGSMSMFDYIEKKRSIADTLAESCVLRGLDSSYTSIKSAINIRVEKVSPNKLSSLLMHEEEHIDRDAKALAGSTTTPSTSSPPPAPSDNAMTNTNNTTGEDSSSSRGRGGRGEHNRGRWLSSKGPVLRHASATWHSQNQSSNRPLCQTCNRYGHLARNC
ncbi:LOW QUALITY PROTEIN: hypothetical protein V2J09_022031, partial [Rumex salicifolius]